MSIEFWILLLVVTSAVSAWIGFAYARRGGPTQAELDALEQELDQARQQSETVQSGVNEHFEQSAVLFGNLAKDYREFLEHFSDSAQSLGLPASRARELLEQGFQPLISHEDDADESVVDVTPEATAPEPPLMEDVVAKPKSATDESMTAGQHEGLQDEEAGRTDIIVEMPGEGPTEDAGRVAENCSDTVPEADSDAPPNDLHEPASTGDSIKQRTG